MNEITREEWNVYNWLVWDYEMKPYDISMEEIRAASGG